MYICVIIILKVLEFIYSNLDINILYIYQNFRDLLVAIN